MPKPLPTHWPDLIAAHTAHVRAVALKLTQNQDDAYDLAQDVLCKVLISEDKFEMGSNLKGWLYTVTRNIFITNYQTKKRKGGTHQQIEAVYESAMINHISRNEGELSLLEQEVHIAMEELPDHLKSLLKARSEGYKYDELAASAGVPVGTIKNRIFVGRAMLQEKMKRTKTTVLDIPMSNFQASPEIRQQRWHSLFSCLSGLLRDKSPQIINMGGVAQSISCSLAQAGQMIATLVQLDALSREKDRYPPNRFLYQLGSVSFDDIDLDQAHKVTTGRIALSKAKPEKSESGRNGKKQRGSFSIDEQGIRYTAMPPVEIDQLIKETKESPWIPIPSHKRLGFCHEGAYQFFGTDQQAIEAATELMKQINLAEIHLVREAGIIQLIPKVEIY